MSSQPNQSLIDGLSVLQLLAASKEPLGSRETGRLLDLNSVRANRLLKTLADIGLASQNQKKKYSIGPGIHTLTAQALFGSKILNQALPLIKQIKFPKFTVALGVFWNGYVTYLFHGKADEPIENSLGRIGLTSSFNTVMGRLMLSYEEDSKIDHLYKLIEPELSKKEVKQFVKQVRKDNYYIKKTDGSYNIAVPIGKPAAMGIALAGIPNEEAPQPYLDELTAISQNIIL